MADDKPPGAEPPTPDAAHAPTATPPRELYEGEEVDPDLLVLPRRRRRHPIIAAAVVGLSIYLMVFVRADLIYFFQPARPTPLGDAAEAVRQGKLRPNTHVTVNGLPDRKYAALLQGKVTGFDSIFRLQQTGSRLFVQTKRSERTSDRVVESVHSGRAVRFSTLPYAGVLREHFERLVSNAHDFDFAALRDAKQRGVSTLKDRAGVDVTLGRDTLVWINVAYPNEQLIQLARRQYPTLAEAQRMLPTDLPLVEDVEQSPTFWRFVALVQGPALQALQHKLGTPALNAGIVRRQVSYSARWDQLRVEGQQLVIDAADPHAPLRYTLVGGKLVGQRDSRTRLNGSEVLYLSSASKFTVPADAIVLLAGEAPGDYWYYVVLYVALVSFVIFNALALVSRLRGR